MIVTSALLCMALNIYYESRGESEVGQIAVAHVTQNRVIENHSSICKEVFRPHQFSWTLRPYKIPSKEDESWKRALNIAEKYKTVRDPTNGAQYFSSESSLKKRVSGKVIGNHIFYK